MAVVVRLFFGVRWPPWLAGEERESDSSWLSTWETLTCLTSAVSLDANSFSLPLGKEGERKIWKEKERV